MFVLSQCLGALYPPGTNPLSGLVMGWLRQVVMHLWKCHQPWLFMHSFSILNKELTLSDIKRSVDQRLLFDPVLHSSFRWSLSLFGQYTLFLQKHWGKNWTQINQGSWGKPFGVHFRGPRPISEVTEAKFRSFLGQQYSQSNSKIQMPYYWWLRTTSVLLLQIWCGLQKRW